MIENVQRGCGGTKGQVQKFIEVRITPVAAYAERLVRELLGARGELDCQDWATCRLWLAGAAALALGPLLRMEIRARNISNGKAWLFWTHYNEQIAFHAPKFDFV